MYVNGRDITKEHEFIEVMYDKSENLGTFIKRIAGAVRTIAEQNGLGEGTVSENPHSPLSLRYWKSGGPWIQIAVMDGSIYLICDAAIIKGAEEKITQDVVSLKYGNRGECYVELISDFETLSQDDFDL